MKPARHFWCSAAFSASLAPWLKWRALWVLVGGVVLDLDRLIWYVASRRSLRLRDAMDRFQGRDRIRDDVRFLHSVEFLAVVAVGAVFLPWVRILALGVVLHVVLDLMVHKSRGRFWLYFDASHLRCLTYDCLERRAFMKAEAEAWRTKKSSERVE